MISALPWILLFFVFAATPAAAREENGTPPVSEASWVLPEPGDCEPDGGLKGWPLGHAAPDLPVTPGDVVGKKRLRKLEPYLPKEVWRYRDRFFLEGVLVEIGPCFADYSPPDFYFEATEDFAGRAQLLENGGLGGYIAGQPFPIAQIAAADPDAGLKWAWNVEHRYQGAGFRGPFRTSDLIGRTGRAEPFEGEMFKLLTSHRADLDKKKYAERGAKSRHWVAGGSFSQPFSAKDYKWRQFRHEALMKDPDRTDDLHAYVPNLRRVRRMPANNVEGIYMPSFSVGVQHGRSATGSGPSGGASDGADRDVGESSTTITTKRSGFEGLEIRPILYDYRVLGVQDVLALINAKRPAYPESKKRDFGKWGLSFADDRWDLRRTVVFEGRVRGAPGKTQITRIVYYADIQTGQPLYYISYRYLMHIDVKESVIDVGMFVGRWSEDRASYPAWPDDPRRPVRVIDPVGAAFANIADKGGWRRESWTIVSTAPDKRGVRRMMSVSDLAKSR